MPCLCRRQRRSRRQRQRNAPPPCLHGARPRCCAFAGCPHFTPDGPRDEKWTFWPGVTAEDIAAGLAENALQHARAPGSASPIHLVVNEKMRQRTEGRPK